MQSAPNVHGQPASRPGRLVVSRQSTSPYARIRSRTILSRSRCGPDGHPVQVFRSPPTRSRPLYRSSSNTGASSESERCTDPSLFSSISPYSEIAVTSPTSGTWTQDATHEPGRELTNGTLIGRPFRVARASSISVRSCRDTTAAAQGRRYPSRPSVLSPPMTPSPTLAFSPELRSGARYLPPACPGPPSSRPDAPCSRPPPALQHPLRGHATAVPGGSAATRSRTARAPPGP